ncbi:HNH endonuclease [Bradyrhizobium elkanii]|nr:HNH endonuclease [Bradyrhizobium elkanii]
MPLECHHADRRKQFRQVILAAVDPLADNDAAVHHLIPLHKAPKEGRQVLLKDLAIVCANCHAMIHTGGQCRPLEGLIS